MRVITAYSHKGGTGKTTALLMLASAIESRGQSALLIDCDPHQAFAAYKARSVQDGRAFWSEKMDVRFMHYEATSIIALEETLLSADESGRYDYCLLNLAGVDHPFNRKVLRYAEMTLLPFAPAALDLMELPEALNVIKKLGEDGEIGDARVVFSRMKSRMTVAQQDYVQDVIENFPRLVTEIKDTAILADLVMRGLLGKSIAHFEPIAKGLQVSEVNNLKNALASCNALLDEIDTLIDAQG